MNFSKKLFLIVLIAASPYTFSTIVEVNTSELFKEKKITALCDNHNATTSEKEQTECLIDFFHKTTDTQYLILIEQASKIFLTPKYNLLFKLNGHLQQASPSLDNVTVQNIEIRYPAIIACGLLQSKSPEDYDAHKQYIIDNNTKTVGNLNFQDILEELDAIKQSLNTYYHNHENTCITTIYSRHITCSDIYYDSFKKTIEQLHSQHSSILEYAKNEGNNEQKSLLAEFIANVFNPLLDLNILQNILQSKHENIIILAGRTHTRDVFSMLCNLKAHSIYRSKEYIDDRPSTPLEITNGLLAKYQEPTGTCSIQ